jgi:hypothetical protein
MITFFSSGCFVGSNVVSVLIPYVSLDILDVIERGFRPNRHAPLMTETYGRRGTSTYIYGHKASKVFLISDLRKGDSEKPPTMKI